MSDLKAIGTPIILGGKEYGMRFTLNTINDIQDKYDINISDINTLFEGKPMYKNLAEIISLMINEDSDCLLDETGEIRQHIDARFVGRHINVGNAKSMMMLVKIAVNNGTPKNEEDDPNVTSE